jgi:hypothetical protein
MAESSSRQGVHPAPLIATGLRRIGFGPGWETRAQWQPPSLALKARPGGCSRQILSQTGPVAPPLSCSAPSGESSSAAHPIDLRRPCAPAHPAPLRCPKQNCHPERSGDEAKRSHRIVEEPAPNEAEGTPCSMAESHSCQGVHPTPLIARDFVASALDLDGKPGHSGSRLCWPSRRGPEVAGDKTIPKNPSPSAQLFCAVR